MKLFSSLLCYTIATLALTACTTGEEKVIKDLENMPGVTCVIGADGQSHCGPDSLKDTQNP